MRFDAEKIKNTKFSTTENGYAKEEVDEFLKRLELDYIEISKLFILDGDNVLYNAPKVMISNNYQGELESNTFYFDGTVKEWQEIKNKGVFKDVPCIRCVDGDVIQKL